MSNKVYLPQFAVKHVSSLSLFFYSLLFPFSKIYFDIFIVIYIQIYVYSNSDTFDYYPTPVSHNLSSSSRIVIYIFIPSPSPSQCSPFHQIPI